MNRTINTNELYLFTSTLLENNSQFNNQIQDKLMQTFLDWLNNFANLNLYVNKNHFFKYAKQNNEDTPSSIIHSFINTLLSTNLFLRYYSRNKTEQPMNWYQPESALYNIGDEITQLSKEIARRSNMFINKAENIEKFDEFCNQLDKLKRKMEDNIYCLNLYRYDKTEAENFFDDEDVERIKNKLHLALQEKLTNKSILLLLKLNKTDYELQEILTLFREGTGVELTEFDYLKIVEALWI